MTQKKTVKINMHDTFSGAKHSVIRLMDADEINQAESLMTNRVGKKMFNKLEGIAYHWAIDGVEVLID